MIACLDACVLYPTVLRQVLVGVAEAGLIRPVWSERLFEEWRRTAERLHPGDGVFATGEMARLNARWPEAQIPEASDLEGQLWLPDPSDIHVLATAITGRANVIITLNLKDFPARELVGHDVTARHPDAVLYALWLDHPEQVEDVATRVHAAADAINPISQRALFKRARLPRLGKAVSR